MVIRVFFSQHIIKIDNEIDYRCMRVIYFSGRMTNYDYLSTYQSVNLTRFIAH